MYQTQPLGYAASPVLSLFSSLISHCHSTKLPNHFINEDHFWLSAWGTSNGARLLLVVEGNLVDMTMLLLQCSLLLLLLTTMLVLCIALYKQDVQTLLAVVQISKQFLLTWVYTPQLRAPFSVIRLTTHLNLCMPRFTDLQNRMRKVLPCPVCLQSVSRRHSVVLNGCKHVLCKACLIQYLESEAGDNRNPRCVMPQCQQALDMEQCQVVLHQHKPIFEKLSDLAVMESLPADMQFICPYPTCSAISLLDTGRDYKVQQQTCPHCRQPVCVQCKCIWHDGVSCDRYEGAPDDMAVLALARQEGLARCPGCRIVTQKMQGCDYMKCTRCGKDYAYSAARVY